MPGKLWALFTRYSFDRNHWWLDWFACLKSEHSSTPDHHGWGKPAMKTCHRNPPTLEEHYFHKSCGFGNSTLNTRKVSWIDILSIWECSLHFLDVCSCLKTVCNKSSSSRIEAFLFFGLGCQGCLESGWSAEWSCGQGGLVWSGCAVVVL